MNPPARKLEKCTSVHCSVTTDYGRPMNPFFIEIQTFWLLGQTNWTNEFRGILGIFGQTKYQHPLRYSESLVHVFFNIQPLFLKKNISLYFHTPIIYQGLGFEFWPQRIRDLAFVCPQSVVATNPIRTQIIDYMYLYIFTYKQATKVKGRSICSIIMPDLQALWRGQIFFVKQF